MLQYQNTATGKLTGLWSHYAENHLIILDDEVGLAVIASIEGDQFRYLHNGTIWPGKNK